jgi:hypothetical protein
VSRRCEVEGEVVDGPPCTPATEAARRHTLHPNAVQHLLGRIPSASVVRAARTQCVDVVPPGDQASGEIVQMLTRWSHVRRVELIDK